MYVNGPTKPAGRKATEVDEAGESGLFSQRGRGSKFWVFVTNQGSFWCKVTHFWTFGRKGKKHDLAYGAKFGHNGKIIRNNPSRVKSKLQSTLHMCPDRFMCKFLDFEKNNLTFDSGQI